MPLPPLRDSATPREPQSPIRLDRLQALLDHMRGGKRHHAQFAFHAFNIPLADEADEPDCGTAGCMAGELPTLFPDHWKWVGEGTHSEPKLRGLKCTALVPEQLGAFFGLSLEAVHHLFYPRRQNTKLFGGGKLQSFSPLEAVTANLETFIARHTPSVPAPPHSPLPAREGRGAGGIHTSHSSHNS